MVLGVGISCTVSSLTHNGDVKVSMFIRIIPVFSKVTPVFVNSSTFDCKADLVIHFPSQSK